VFIGHVDSGKSTICGDILLNCNLVDKNELKTIKLKAREAKRES
jgi:peptide chain release factor subunit 3